MSHSDRGPGKSQKRSGNDEEGSDLSLSGSQMSLVSRPRSVMGKASMRALAVGGPRARRPMSAIPTFTYVEGVRDKRRPYSADSQPLLLSTSAHRRMKLASQFPLSALERDCRSVPFTDFEFDGDVELSSSAVLSCPLSEPVGGSWGELEMHGLYLGQMQGVPMGGSSKNSSDLLCYSDISEAPTCSEKSLGERIRVMAQDVCHTTNTSPVKSNRDVKPVTSSFRNQGLNDSDAIKDYDRDNTKNMTTRELHFRMLEAGLVLHPKNNPSRPEHDKPQSPNFSGFFQSCHGASKENERESQHSTFNGASKVQPEPDKVGRRRDLNEDLKIPPQKEHNNELHNEQNVSWRNESIFEEMSSDHHFSIDQISFPDEHDIESLEGETQAAAGVEEDKTSRNCFKSGKNVNNSGQASTLAPVRFHQWVAGESHEKNYNGIENNVRVPYFCGTQLSPVRAKPQSEFLDCMVEEVTGDSEEPQVECLTQTQKNQVDLQEQELFEFKAGQIVSDEDCFGRAKRTDRLIESAEKTEMSHILKTNECDIPNKYQHTAESGNLVFPKGSSFDTSVEELKCGTTSSQHSCDFSNQPACSTKSFTASNQLGEHSSDSKKSNSVCSRRAIRFSERANITGAKKSDAIHHKDNRSKSEKSEGTASRRKVEQGQGLNSRRRRQSLNPLDSSPRPKEEEFPGESQQELASWMSMCAEQPTNCDTGVAPNLLEPEALSQVQPNTFMLPRTPDSPYNDIMTILRVLEEEEDESSLLRILQKRGSAETPEDCISSSSSLRQMSSIKTDTTKHISQTTEAAVYVLSPKERPIESGAKELSDLKVSESSIKTESVNKTPLPLSCAHELLPQESTQGELRDLLTFLDAVDQSCSSILDSTSRNSSPTQHRSTTPYASECHPDTHGLEDLLLLGHTDLAKEVVSLRLAVEERNATIDLLRTAIREMKEGQERRDSAHTKQLENSIQQVKTECEAVVKRHQKFIDQLISDKASLSERCEVLIQQARETEERHHKSLATLEQKHKVELQRMKDIAAATEKLKRERWMENKTQKIKELTVRGLEPELTRLTTQHEQEMSALRTLHAQELEQMELRAARRFSQQMETLREQLVQEKEDALARERELLRQRIEKEQAVFEEEGAEQRRRLVAEVRRERDRLAAQEARLEAQFEERKRNLELEAEQDRERARRDYAEKIDVLHRKQQHEISQLREALRAEKEAWMTAYQQQQQQVLSQTTTDIREQLKRERDKEIEVVIERLENEATLSREEKEKVAENRIRRVRDQLTTELKEVESSLHALKSKYSEVRAALQEKEDLVVSLETQNRSLHTQLLETSKISDQLSAERADLKKSLRAELKNEIDALHQQLEDQRSKHQQELAMRAERAEQELHQLYARVKLAIAKKEEVVKVARSKQTAAEEHSAHLQALLEHRRRESLLS